MQKQALNKYEKYLINQPKDRKFSDPRVQKAFENLQNARQQATIGTGIAALSNSPEGLKAVDHHMTNATNSIRANRNKVSTGSIEYSPAFYTNKGKKRGSTATNDILGSARKNYTAKLGKKQGIQPGVLPRDKNRYFKKAVSFMRRRPVVSALAGFTGGALIGSAAYGIKKDLER